MEWSSRAGNEFAANPAISSVFIGEDRRIHIAQQGSKKKAKIATTILGNNGSLLHTDESFQNRFMYKIPKETTSQNICFLLSFKTCKTSCEPSPKTTSSVEVQPEEEATLIQKPVTKPTKPQAKTVEPEVITISKDNLHVAIENISNELIEIKKSFWNRQGLKTAKKNFGCAT